jgi:hypothetical protein
MVSSFGVEAISVDHRLLRSQPKDSRFGITGLRHGSGSSNFNDGRANCKKRVRNIGMLVNTGRGCYRVSDGTAKHLHLQIPYLVGIATLSWIKAKVPERLQYLVRGLVSLFWVGIEPSQSWNDDIPVYTSSGVRDVDIDDTQS